MENFATTGTQRFLPPGSCAVPDVVWSELKVAPPAAGGCCGAAALAGPAGHHARCRTLANPIFTDLPVTDRLRMSASEP